MVTCDRGVLESPPQIGSVLTVKHSGNQEVKSPYFWRERHDITWEAISNCTRTMVFQAFFGLIGDR
jgi:hypothetical protein